MTGCGVFLLSYRGYGKSTGSASEVGLKQGILLLQSSDSSHLPDALEAYNYIKENVSSDIILYGQSLGGAVALHLASVVSPKAVVIENTFLSIVRL